MTSKATSMSKRIETIDIARGIGILLVVLAHNDFGFISQYGYEVIYSFHMPLFFFLSGYFIKTNISFFEFSKKRFHSLLKPYLFTLFLIYATSVSFEKMAFGTAIRRIVKSLYGTGVYIDWVQLWFLPNLFVVSLYAFIFLVLVGRLNNRWLRLGILTATLALSLPFLKSFYPFSVSLLGNDYELFGLPFSLDLVFLSGFYYILGSEARQLTTEKMFDNYFLLGITGIGVFALNYFIDSPIDLNTRTYSSFFINTFEAIVGILFTLALSRQIDLHTHRLASLFKYFGRISLIILIFHVPIQDFWGQKVLASTDNLPLSIWIGFFMGVGGSALIYELFIRRNPVAAWWFGREAEGVEIKKDMSP
ncbi:MAG: acyltransferase family protein [Anaerolineales bacterium]|nr:MAG: acyltransferase family protein [Anaerolineales bacterium]